MNELTIMSKAIKKLKVSENTQNMNSAYNIENSKTMEYTPIPREHMYQGIRLGEIFNAVTLDRRSALELKPSDTVIIGYPKSGTTWLQEIVWLIQNSADVELANQRSVWSRIPLIESAPPGLKSGVDAVLQQMEPRIFKSHLPVKFWRRQIKEGKPKVIVVMRNPKDNMVSYYHFINMAYPNCMTWEKWFNNFKLGETTYDGWLNHVNDWWTTFKNDNNVLFLKYEDMKKDPANVVYTIENFLEKNLSETQRNTILQHTAFKNMQKNPATNLKNVSFLNQENVSFQRKGEIGDWKNYFTSEQSLYLENVCKAKLQGTGLYFQYE